MIAGPVFFFFFFFNDTATTEIYTLSLHDALPIYAIRAGIMQHLTGVGTLNMSAMVMDIQKVSINGNRSEEHTSELQSRLHLVCRLLLEKKKKNKNHSTTYNKLYTSYM